MHKKEAEARGARCDLLVQGAILRREKVRCAGVREELGPRSQVVEDGRGRCLRDDQMSAYLRVYLHSRAVESGCGISSVFQFQELFI